MNNLATGKQAEWVTFLVWKFAHQQKPFREWADKHLDKMVATRIISDLKNNYKEPDPEVVTRKIQYAREILAQSGYEWKPICAVCKIETLKCYC